MGLTSDVTVACQSEVLPKNWQVRLELLTDIAIFHGAVPFALEMVKVLEEWGKWEPCLIYNLEQGETRSPMRTSERTRLDLQDLEEPLRSYAGGLQTVGGLCIQSYREVVNRHAVVTQNGSYNALRYQVGQKFEEHVDSVRKHPVLGLRQLSAIVALNEDYDGGELRFPRQNLKFRIPLGAMVMFPSSFTHPHEVLPVTRGVRYTAVTWWF